MHHTEIQPSSTQSFAQRQERLSRILVIDDSPEFSGFMKSLLRRKGYQAHFAGSGREGLRMVRSVKPDLVLLDLALSGMNGLEVFQLLRSDPSTSAVPVLLMTGLDDPHGIYGTAAAAFGADDFLRKPFGENEFLGRVSLLLKTRQSGEILERGSLRAETMTGKFWIAGRRRSLGPKRFELLCHLLRSSEGVTRAFLAAQGWDPETWRKTVQRLRTDLAPGCGITFSGDAYRLVP